MCTRRPIRARRKCPTHTRRDKTLPPDGWYVSNSNPPVHGHTPPPPRMGPQLHQGRSNDHNLVSGSFLAGLHFFYFLHRRFGWATKAESTWRKRLQHFPWKMLGAKIQLPTGPLAQLRTDPTMLCLCFLRFCCSRSIRASITKTSIVRPSPSIRVNRHAKYCFSM